MAMIPGPPPSRRQALRVLAAAPLAGALPRPAAPAPAEPRDVLPMGQPEPIDTLVIHHPGPLGTVTGITRVWAEGAPARCRLCVDCRARHDVCAMIVTWKVPREDAPLFSSVGLRDLNDRKTKGGL